MQNKLYRIIDANLNRSREGLRVIEDIVRFCLNNKKMAGMLKRIRHEVSDTVKNVKSLIGNRNAEFDVGKEFNPFLEGKKKDVGGIVISNFRRVEESLRVLEDVSKIIMPEKTKTYKNLRFRVYGIEKRLYGKI